MLLHIAFHENRKRNDYAYNYDELINQLIEQIILNIHDRRTHGGGCAVNTTLVGRIE